MAPLSPPFGVSGHRRHRVVDDLPPRGVGRRLHPRQDRDLLLLTMLVSALALSSGYLNAAAPGSRLSQSRVASVSMDLQ